MQAAESSAIQNASLKDRTSLVASRRAICVRPVSNDEKTAVGHATAMDAAAVLVRLCWEPSRLSLKGNHLPMM